jgi:Holliday junction DNA helicase RuvB
VELAITSGATAEIARRARGTPRIALRLLRRVRDFAAVGALELVDDKICATALDELGIDEQGLEHIDRRYLSFIAQHYRDSHVGINTLAIGLNERKETLEETVEPYLVQLGLIKKTSRGRALTNKALEML